MPARTKEPRRKLTFKDVNGFDWTLEMSRQGGNISWATWSREAPKKLVQVDYYGTYPVVRSVLSEPGVPVNVVVPNSHYNHPAPTDILRAVKDDGQPGFESQVPGAWVVQSRTTHLVNTDDRWYTTRLAPLSLATAQQVVAFINTFNQFFTSGASRQNRLASKQVKLGRRIKVATLHVAENPAYAAYNIEDLDRGELVDVYVFPDSGTDTIELETVAHTAYGSHDARDSFKRDPYFTSAQVLVQRYMHPDYSTRESLGYDSQQLILVRPLNGPNATYQSGNPGGYDGRSNPLKAEGLYAKTTDVHTLLHDIYKAQQEGWTLKKGVPDSSGSSVPNFPFEVKLEEIRWDTGEVREEQEARVEYDGRDKHGQPRVRITPVPPFKYAFSERSRNRARKPVAYTATQEQLQADELTKEKEGTRVLGTQVRIKKLDRERILVALDARYERGLKGLGRVDRTRLGNVIHLDNVMVRELNGTYSPLPGFSNECVSGGARTVLLRVVEAMEAAREGLQALASRPQKRTAHLLDDEEDDPVNERLRLESVIAGLTRVHRELAADVRQSDVDVTTPVCFSGDKMVEAHEGTHALLELEYPMPSGTPGSQRFMEAWVLRNAVIKAAVEEFLRASGPACAKFYDDHGFELDTQHVNTEEVLTAVVGMVTSVRLGDQKLIKETAWAFGTYLRRFTTFVDEREIELSLVPAAKELIARYPTNEDLMEAFVLVLDAKRQEVFSRGSGAQPQQAPARKHMLDGVVARDNNSLTLSNVMFWQDAWKFPEASIRFTSSGSSEVTMSQRERAVWYDLVTAPAEQFMPDAKGQLGIERAVKGRGSKPGKVRYVLHLNEKDRNALSVWLDTRMEQPFSGLGADAAKKRQPGPTQLIQKRTGAFTLRFATHVEYRQSPMQVAYLADWRQRPWSVDLQEHELVPGRFELVAHSRYSQEHPAMTALVLWSGNADDVRKLMAAAFDSGQPHSEWERPLLNLHLTVDGQHDALLLEFREYTRDHALKWVDEAVSQKPWDFSNEDGNLIDPSGLNLLLFREPVFIGNESGYGPEVLKRVRAGEPMLARADSYGNNDELMDTTFWLMLGNRLYRVGDPNSHKPTQFHTQWWKLLDSRPEFRELVRRSDWKNPLLQVALDEILAAGVALPERADLFKGAEAVYGAAGLMLRGALGP